VVAATHPDLLGVGIDESTAVRNLETICAGPLTKKWGLETPVDAFVNASPARNWAQGSQSKMRIQTVLAATCETQPDVSFANHWHLNSKYHLPLDDSSF
jgi:hypothetical protein